MNAKEILSKYLSKELKRKLDKPKNLEYIFKYYAHDVRKYLVDYKISLEDAIFKQLVFNADGVIIIADYDFDSNTHTYRFGKQETIQVVGYVYADELNPREILHDWLLTSDSENHNYFKDILEYFNGNIDYCLSYEYGSRGLAVDSKYTYGEGGLYEEEYEVGDKIIIVNYVDKEPPLTIKELPLGDLVINREPIYSFGIKTPKTIYEYSKL